MSGEGALVISASSSCCLSNGQCPVQQIVPRSPFLSRSLRNPVVSKERVNVWFSGTLGTGETAVLLISAPQPSPSNIVTDPGQEEEQRDARQSDRHTQVGDIGGTSQFPVKKDSLPCRLTKINNSELQ